MAPRSAPPPDISPLEFFEVWVPTAVATDPERRRRVAGLDATIQFELHGEDGGHFYVELRDGLVRGARGRVDEPDLHLSLAVETWRRLNTGELNAPGAASRGLLKFQGSLHLALRLHFILR